MLLAPSGSPNPFYAEFGWVGGAGCSSSLPDAETVWTQEGSGTLGVNQPVTLAYDNGEGLIFRRTIRVDEHYLFTVEDRVENKSAAQIALYPYALISRHGRPQIEGFFILHEGLIGVIGDQGLQEVSYANIEDRRPSISSRPIPGSASPTNIGRRPCFPNPKCRLQIRFSSGRLGGQRTYQTDYPGRDADPAARRPGLVHAPTCSPARRRSRSSTATSASSASTGSNC